MAVARFATAAPWTREFTAKSTMFSVARRVRFQDIDAAGILFYARAFEYLHDAYAALLEARGIDLPAVIRERRWGAPLAHAEADFKAPMRYGDRVVVAILRGAVGTTSLKVFYEVRAEDDPAHVHCTGMTTHVFIDLSTFATRNVPDEIRSLFDAVGDTGSRGIAKAPEDAS
jgi:YbgC/YbaW family acyl-CoA thioester hydrolase